MTDRIIREVDEAIQRVNRSYRITWSPGMYETLEAFDLQAAYHLAWDIAESSYLSGDREPEYPVMIEEIETGRAWTFERPAFAGYKRETIDELERLGIVREVKRS